MIRFRRNPSKKKKEARVYSPIVDTDDFLYATRGRATIIPHTHGETPLSADTKPSEWSA